MNVRNTGSGIFFYFKSFVIQAYLIYIDFKFSTERKHLHALWIIIGFKLQVRWLIGKKNNSMMID